MDPIGRGRRLQSLKSKWPREVGLRRITLHPRNFLGFKLLFW